MGCDGSGRGPPSMPGVVGRGGPGYGGRRPGAPGRCGAPGREPAAGGPGRAPLAGCCVGGGCTILGWDTAGLFAGASGRAGCTGAFGSSMRSRSVGGTKRPGADDGADGAEGALGAAGLAATGARAAA